MPLYHSPSGQFLSIKINSGLISCRRLPRPWVDGNTYNPATTPPTVSEGHPAKSSVQITSVSVTTTTGGSFGVGYPATLNVKWRLQLTSYVDASPLISWTPSSPASDLAPIAYAVSSILNEHRAGFKKMVAMWCK